MKFVVRKEPLGNAVTVTLHDDTKSKIKKIAWWTLIGSCGGYLAKEYYPDVKNKFTSK